MKNMLKFIGIFITVLVVLATAVFAADADPAITAVSDKTIEERETLTLTITSTPADVPETSAVVFGICYDTNPEDSTPCSLSTLDGTDSLKITVGSTEANLSRLADTSAQFKWTPDLTQEGSYTFNIAASDGDSSTSDTFTVTVTDKKPQLTVQESILIGSSNQRRSNPNHEREDRKEANETVSIKITNTGEEQLIDLTASTSLGSEASEASQSPLTLSHLNPLVELDKETLNPGENATATVTFGIPKELSAVDRNGEEKQWHVATITFTAERTQGDSASVSGTTIVRMQAENRLRLSDGNIMFNGESENINHNDDVRDVRPGNEITLELEVESEFSDEEDVEISDVQLDVINDELDVDKREDGDDLDPEDTDTLEVSFDIDEDASRGDERLEIILLGEDEFGAFHGERWIVNLEITREDHEIYIQEISLQPETVSCQLETELSVDVRNTGRRDEDEVYIRVEVPDLGFGDLSDEFALDENSEKTRRFTIPVPENTDARNYRVTVYTLYNTDRQSQTDTIILRKISCGDEPADSRPAVPDQTQEDLVVIQEPVPPQEPVVEEPAEVPVDVETEEGFFGSTGFIILLVFGYILVIGGGAAVAVMLLRK